MEIQKEGILKEMEIIRSVQRPDCGLDDWDQFPAVAMMMFFLIATAVSRSSLGSTQSPTQQTSEALSRRGKRPGRKPIAHLHLVPRLKLCGSVSPLPHTSS